MDCLCASHSALKGKPKSGHRTDRRSRNIAAGKCLAECLAPKHQLSESKNNLYWIQLLTQNVKLDLDKKNTHVLI